MAEVELLGFSEIQRQTLEANFDHVGPFYRSRDLHPMLDCAAAPELALSPGQTSVPTEVDRNAPLSLAFPAKLREEYFGGILFDTENHRHYMLDSDGYAILRTVAEDHSTWNAFSPTESPVQSIEDSLRHLVAGGLLSTAGNSAAVGLFPARDRSLAYLQSPIIVEVEVTYGCFRACRHCAYSASPEARLPDELTAEQWGTVFQELAANGVLIVQLTGGDPLFRGDALDIVEAADDAGLSVYVRSDTVALDAEKVRRIRNLRHLWHVGTSLDGASEQVHDWMRGRGAFRTFVERLEALAEAGIAVSVGATLHTENYTDVRAMGSLADGLGASWFDIGFLAPVGRGANMSPFVLGGDQIRVAIDMYLEGISAGDYVPSHAHYLQRASQDDPLDDMTELIDQLPYITEWPFSRLRLDPTGSSYTAGKLKGSDFAGGFNALTTPLPEIWDCSPNLVALRGIGGGGRIHGLDYRLLQSSHEFL